MCFYVTMWFKKMKQMERILKITTVAVLILSAAACSNESPFDASGSFEAVEVIISAEATGTLKGLQLRKDKPCSRASILVTLTVYSCTCVKNRWNRK
jgi:hypothetical protein